MLISFRGGKIHYSDSGCGEIIVLIHGYLESMEVWENFAGRLSQKFRILRIDLPGHGHSDLFSDINSMELMAEVIKEILDIQGIKKVFLIGHSMGGYAALAFLQLFPEYLSGYSLFHSHPFSDTAEAVEKRKQNIALTENGKKDEMIPGFVHGLYAPKNLDRLKEAVEKSVSVALGTDKKTIIADLRGMMARPDRSNIVREAKVPFLWILGTMDSHIDYRTIQQKVRLPENAQIVILENSGHMGFIEEEELSVKAIGEFVKSPAKRSL